MALIHFILNLAGLLLWINWCSVAFDPVARARTSTLAGTIRPVRPRRNSRWLIPLSILALLALRALGYRVIGPAFDWVPALDLGPIILHFRSDDTVRLLLFSALSFARMLGIFYSGLVFLLVLNGRMAEAEPFQKLARLYLGRLGRWPLPLLVCLGILTAATFWTGVCYLLARLNLAPAQAVRIRNLEQGMLVTAHELLTLRHLVAAFLLAHLFSSYVYLGEYPLWKYINITGRNLLRPLRWLPLRLGRVDFAPLVEIALVFAATEFCLSLIAGQQSSALQWLVHLLGRRSA